MAEKKKPNPEPDDDQNQKKPEKPEKPKDGQPEQEADFVIPAPRMQVMVFPIVGTTPYVSNRLSPEIAAQIRDKQAEGGTAKNRKNRAPKDFAALFRGATHRDRLENWPGIPASAFRLAMISACRLVGHPMTLAKMTIFCVADGWGDDGTPLVRIHSEPRQLESPVQLRNSIDIRARPIFDPGWRANVRLRFDLDQFRPADVLNLLMRVGEQVGVGEGRPDSKKSGGCGWGLFRIEGAAGEEAA
jgi:hypothetical protein